MPASSSVSDRWTACARAVGTLPGRAIVIGVVLRLAVYAIGLALGAVPPFLAVIDTVAGLALAVGAVYVVVKLVALGEAAPAVAGAPRS